MKVHHAVTHSPSVLNVLVHDDCNGDGNEGIIPAGEEHDGEAEKGAQQRGGPVVVTEPRAPVGSLQQRLQRARKVHTHVAHQEEPVRGGGVCGGGRRGRGCVCV